MLPELDCCRLFYSLTVLRKSKCLSALILEYEMENRFLKVGFPANRKRFHNVFVWLYRGFVATQRCVNVFITFSIRCGKVVLEPTTGKRCRNV